MIQAVLLIALGFLTASLIGVLVAPALWHRASRLSRKRLEQTLPVTLPEIQAAQDQLRASYAVRMRRLETALAGAKQKAAAQLVDNSRLQMQIVALKDQMADLDLNLSERRNAATVLEQTITRRFPELDREITEVKTQLQERVHSIQDLSNKLNRRSEDLEDAQRAAASYEEEVARLRQALEKNSGDRTGRRLRGASKWSLDDYRAEYDRLNLELSKLRQQVAQLQERDAGQSTIIKGELQRLAELMLASTQPKAAPDAEQPPAVKRSRGAGIRRDRPVPWSESVPKPDAAPPALDGGHAAAQKQGAPAKAANGPSLATGFGAPPDNSAKPESSSASGESADSPRSGRSRLLQEAVPEKAGEHNSGTSLKEDAALRSAPATPGGNEPAAEAAINGSVTAPESAPSQEEQAGRPAATLLEKLREAGGETA
jgi:hypothetical protein